METNEKNESGKEVVNISEIPVPIPNGKSTQKKRFGCAIAFGDCYYNGSIDDLKRYDVWGCAIAGGCHPTT